MAKMNLDKEEHAILDSVEAGEWQPVKEMDRIPGTRY